METYDVVIIGGGPAGMSAALILGRCRRKILIFDQGNQRNRKAREMHGYLSRDGISPAEFREKALRDLEKYYITIRNKQVRDAIIEGNLFKLTDEEGNTIFARRVLIATGLVDKVPDLPGIEEFYGISVHHCPICDGWEIIDKPIAIYGKGNGVYEAALHHLHWSKELVVITSGKTGLTKEKEDYLKSLGIPVFKSKVTALEGRNGWLNAIAFEDGSRHECCALFFATGYRAHWKIPEKLHARYRKKEELWVDHLQQSSVKGLYVAGDAACDMKLVIIAAADGAKAGVAIHNSLYEEDLR